MPIEDSVSTAAYRTTGGTPALRNFRPQQDAPIVAALRAGGAIVLGKTNLHELSYGWTSNNLAFGAVHNPYDAARIPGGSSGGTAAAVAGDWSPLFPTPLRGVRLGVVRDYWFAGLDPEVQHVAEQALRRLVDAGAELVETTLPGLAPLIAATTYAVQNHDVRMALPRYLAEYGAAVGCDEVVRAASPDIQATFRSDVLPGGANFVTADAYGAARDRRLLALGLSLERALGPLPAPRGIAA
jgi:Asp-tRNA(Asn)/Glu-tRNA(Gln) amidotransferase A subunit family amidase